VTLLMETGMIFKLKLFFLKVFKLKLGAVIYLKTQKFTRIFCCKNNRRCVIEFSLTQ